jgi:hypothetical protein
MKKARTKQSKWRVAFYVFFVLAWVVAIVRARQGGPLNVCLGGFFACIAMAVTAAATSCVGDGVVGRGASKCTRDGQPFGFWFQVVMMYLFAAGILALAVMAFTKRHG